MMYEHVMRLKHPAKTTFFSSNQGISIICAKKHITSPHVHIEYVYMFVHFRLIFHVCRSIPSNLGVRTGEFQRERWPLGSLWADELPAHRMECNLVNARSKKHVGLRCHQTWNPETEMYGGLTSWENHLLREDNFPLPCLINRGQT